MYSYLNQAEEITTVKQAFLALEAKDQFNNTFCLVGWLVLHIILMNKKKEAVIFPKVLPILVLTTIFYLLEYLNKLGYIKKKIELR